MEQIEWTWKERWVELCAPNKRKQIFVIDCFGNMKTFSRSCVFDTSASCHEFDLKLTARKKTRPRPLYGSYIVITLRLAWCNCLLISQLRHDRWVIKERMTGCSLMSAGAAANAMSSLTRVSTTTRTVIDKKHPQIDSRSSSIVGGGSRLASNVIIGHGGELKRIQFQQLIRE